MIQVLGKGEKRGLSLARSCSLTHTSVIINQSSVITATPLCMHAACAHSWRGARLLPCKEREEGRKKEGERRKKGAAKLLLGCVYLKSVAYGGVHGLIPMRSYGCCYGTIGALYGG